MAKNKFYWFSSEHRLLLAGAAGIWLLVFVQSTQRNYQDEWILADILWPFLGFVCLLLGLMVTERKNQYVALMGACLVWVTCLIPSLKYSQPYGGAIDVSNHYLLVDSLVNTGRALTNNIYSTIPGLHAWLASQALTGSYSTNEAVRFGLPLIAGLQPLLLYWLCHQAQVPATSIKYTIILSCLSLASPYTLNGTTFSQVPFFAILSAAVLAEYFPSTARIKWIYYGLAASGVPMLIVWHTSTPAMTPLILIAVSITPVLGWLLNKHIRSGLSIRLFYLALFSGLAFFLFHTLQNDLLYQKTNSLLMSWFYQPETVQKAIPARTFELPITDTLQVAWVLHGRDIALLGLMLFGLFVLWKKRASLGKLSLFYSFWFLACIPFGVMVLLGGGGIGYQRFLIMPVLFAPIFAGPGLAWLVENFSRVSWRITLPARVSAGVIAILLLFGWVSQVYFCQPLIPMFTISDQTQEYVLWVHNTSSIYQTEVLSFAETHSNPDTRFAIDNTSANQYTRLYGKNASSRRGLYRYLLWQEPVDTDRVGLYLLHWPGPAGALSEQAEYRSHEMIQNLRETPGWGLVYTNGESFILWIP